MTQSHKTQPGVFLPRRISDRRSPGTLDKTGADDLAQAFIRIAAERIERLPGVRSEITSATNNRIAADFYIESAYMPRLRHADPYLMCHIDNGGIQLQQISLPDRDEIRRKGWSMHTEDSICVFLPRDGIEIEVAWRVVALAYLFETSPSTRPRANGNSPRTLPNCSSTAKYWM
jgi:hypothetical protein